MFHEEPVICAMPRIAQCKPGIHTLACNPGTVQRFAQTSDELHCGTQTLHIYSKTSEQRTHWGQMTCFVPCREVVLFSEVQIVLLL